MRQAAALIVLLTVSEMCLACRNADVVTASYATLQEARDAGAIQRGWVPGGLPDGTSDLREAHDLDTNRRWGLFSFPVSQSEVLRRLLRPDEVPLTGVQSGIPGRIEWWPVLLRGALNEDQIRAAGLRAYRAAQGDLLFLVNWEQGRAYYWTL